MAQAKYFPLLITFFLFSFVKSFSQPVILPGYQTVNNGWNLLRTVNRALNIPVGGTPNWTVGQTRLSGALFYDSTGTDTGLYVSHGTHWIKLATGGDVSVTGANNGLSLSSGIVQLGGTLLKNTSIGGARLYNLTLDSANFIVRGASGFGPVIPTYTEMQMFFYPKKGAFRAGISTGTAWADANIGTLSVAFGLDNTSSGDYGMTWGNSNAAKTGNYATAFGLQDTASASQATAFGNRTRATATNATAWGINTQATNTNATAWGNGSMATFPEATAWGTLGTIASNGAATAWGRTTTASGNYSTSWGQGTLASGAQSTVWGTNSIASATNATAFGLANVASANQSTAWGTLCFATGLQSTAWGEGSIARGDNYSAWGDGVKVKSFAGTGIGSYNDTTFTANAAAYDVLNRAFSIGIGTADNDRRNAITVLFNGNVGIGTTTPQKILHTVGTVRMASLPTITFDTTTRKPLTIDANGDIASGFWAGAGGGGSGLTVGTTAITSGTANRVLYENSSNILSEDADFTFDGSLITHSAPALGVTQTDSKGFLLTTPTAAALNAQQISPSLHWSARGWETTGSTSQAVDFRSYVLPVQAATVGGTWLLQSATNGGAYTTRISVSHTGNFIFTSDANTAVTFNNASTSDVNIINTGFAASAAVTVQAKSGNFYSWRHISTDNELRLSNAGGTTYLNFTYATGNLALGQSTTAATAKLMIGAGTATAGTAPLKFVSGTVLTTAETGAVEYDGTNLFFTRTGTTRENVLTTASVNTVNPTSPNRTITVVINGTTYYIAAKTTND